MGDIGPPPAERGDLALAFTKERFAENSEHLGTVREADFPDTECGKRLKPRRGGRGMAF